MASRTFTKSLLPRSSRQKADEGLVAIVYTTLGQDKPVKIIVGVIDGIGASMDVSNFTYVLGVGVVFVGKPGN